MKYVAFLDILGFKNKLAKLKQGEAEKYISDFSRTIYDIWEKQNFNLINGYIVSDSVIIYTENVSKESLKELVKAIREIGQEEFRKHSILIRGAIAKGEFNKMDAMELSRLSKGLVVGQAYVDAYLLESAIKTIGIVLQDKVVADYIEADLPKEELVSIDVKQNLLVYRYIDNNFLQNKSNLEIFLNLAKESKWLPHYYNAIYSALKKSGSSDKVFSTIFELMHESQMYKYTDIDDFINGSFADEVDSNYKRRFLKFLRRRIYEKN